MGKALCLWRTFFVHGEGFSHAEGLVLRRLRRQKPGRKANVPAGSGDLFAGMDEGPA
jgi:hypothetical protein